MTHNSSRFKKLGANLPAVNKYDYPDNLAIRGSSDCSFRFGEVASEKEYLYEEWTNNGDFSTYTGNASGFPICRISGDYTSTSFSGWVAYGHSIFHVPPTGFTIPSGNYSLSGDLFLRSIGRFASIGMIRDGVTGSGIGFYKSGLNLSGNRTYQLYGKAKLATGSASTANAQLWVEGYTGEYNQGDVLSGNNTVAVFDPNNFTWVSHRPSGDNFTAQPSTTEFFFDFTTNNFPAATPEAFAVIASVSGSGNFVLFDDIHVDEYMQENAFATLQVPTGYIVQVTPDIGWHDTLAMFEDREGISNPHLKSLGPFTLSSGLFDNSDGTVTVTVAQSELSAVTSNNFRKYLWRAIPYSAAGVVGAKGFPRKFDYVGKIFDEEFSITEIISDPLSVNAIILGTKSARMTILVDDAADHPGLEYPNKSTWKLSIVMDTPEKRISIKGKDKGGATTSAQFVDLRSDIIDTAEQKLWNKFDEHGLLLGVDRLPSESNQDYSERITDAFVNPGTHFFQGAVDGGTRELGFTKYESAIEISFKDTEIPTSSSLEVVSNSTAILIRTSDLEFTETVLVDPVGLTCDLTHVIADDPTAIEDIDGARVNIDQVTVFDDHHERPNLRKIRLKSDKLGGRLVKVTYKYYREYTFREYPTLGELVVAMEGYTDSVGTASIDIRLTPELSGYEASEGLYRGNGTARAGDLISIRWSPMRLHKIGDRRYRESFRNPDGTLWNTKFYSWIQELKANTNIEWGHVRADKAFWDAADNKLDGFDHLPTMCDPAIENYRSVSLNKKIDAEYVSSRLFIDFSGELIHNTILPYYAFTAGVAHNPDLVPHIHSVASVTPVLVNSNDIIVDNTPNLGLALFTGNIH